MLELFRRDGAACWLLVAAACGGREQALTGLASGSSAAGSGSVVSTGAASGVSTGAPQSGSATTAGSLAGAGAGATAGTDAPAMDASAEDAQDSTTQPLSEAGPFEAGQERAGGEASSPAPGACCAGNEPSCAPGICCVAADCSPDQRCLHHVCQTVTCDPVVGGVYYVDPSAGIDASSTTGAQNCPFWTITRAITAIALSRQGLSVSPVATIRI